jgi:hypothetical protein
MQRSGVTKRNDLPPPVALPASLVTCAVTGWTAPSTGEISTRLVWRRTQASALITSTRFELAS